MIDHAVVGYAPFGDVRLVVFPEFAHAAPVYHTVEELRDKLAVELPNEQTDRYLAKAKERNVYIQTGTFLEVDRKYPGLRLQHDLPHRPGRAALQVPQGPPVDSVGGPRQPARRPRLRGADVPGRRDRDRRDRLRDLLRLALPRGDPRTGAAGRGGAGPRLGVHGPVGRDAADGLVDRGQPLPGAGEHRLRRRREPGGEPEHYPPFSWPGGSMVVDYDGRILAQADPGPGEKIVVGPIDIAALRAERERRIGHHMLAHRRSEAYTAQRRPAYPGGRAGEGADQHRGEREGDPGGEGAVASDFLTITAARTLLPPNQAIRQCSLQLLLTFISHKRVEEAEHHQLF